MAYRYRTGRQRRWSVSGTASTNYSLCISTYQFIEFAFARARVFRGIYDPNNPTAMLRLNFGATHQSVLSQDGNTRTVTVYGDSTPTGPNVIIDQFTRSASDPPLVRSYPLTSTYALWCDTEEVIDISSENPKIRIREIPRVGGTMGYRVNGIETSIPITNVNDRSYLLYAASYDLSLYTSSWIKATFDAQGQRTNFGQALADLTGGSVTASLALTMGGGGPLLVPITKNANLSAPTHFVNTVRSNGQDVSTTYDYTATLSASGTSATLSGVPLPVNVTPNDRHDLSGVDRLQAGANIMGYVYANNIWAPTVSMVGPSGKPVSDMPFEITTGEAGTLLPALAGVGSVGWLSRSTQPPSRCTYRLSNRDTVATDGTEEFDANERQRGLLPRFTANTPNIDINEFPIILRGHKWNRKSIGAHKATRYVFGEPGKPLPPMAQTIGAVGWAATGNATASNNGNGLQLVTTPTANALTGAKLNNYSTDWEYRFYRVRFRSVGSANRSITFRFLPFDVAAANDDDNTVDVYASSTGVDGEWKEVVLDRLAAYKAIATKRGRSYVDTEPSFSVGSSPPTAKDAVVMESDTGTFAIVGLAPSTTYEIAWLRGERTQDAVVESTYIQQYAGVDGKRTKLHEPVDTQAPAIPTWGSSIAWPETTLDTARTNLPRWYDDNGFLPADPDLFNSQYESNVECDTEWVPLQPTSAKNAPVTIQVQQAFPSFRKVGTSVGGFTNQYALEMEVGYPCAGDVFQLEGGAYEQTTKFNWEYEVGEQLRGAVIQPPDKLDPLPTVRQAEIIADGETSARLAGDGVPVGGGYCATQDPFAYRARPNGLEAYLVDTDGTPKSGYRGKLWGHRRYWFLGDKSSSWLSVDTGPTGLTFYADVTTSGNIQMSVATNWATTEWESWDTGLASTRPCLRFAPGGFSMWLVYESAGSIVRSFSIDGGRTWGPVVTIAASGAFPCVTVAATGWTLVGWRDTSGAVQVKGVDGFGNTLFGPVAAVASGVAEDAIGLTRDASAGKFYLLYRETGSSGGPVKTVSSTDGKTWA